MSCNLIQFKLTLINNSILFCFFFYIVIHTQQIVTKNRQCAFIKHKIIKLNFKGGNGITNRINHCTMNASRIVFKCTKCF